MAKNKWRIEFAKMTVATVMAIRDKKFDIANSLFLITKLMGIDRKHQRAETIKPLSEINIQNAIDIWIHENGLGYYNKIPTFKEYNKLAKAIHALVDIKLKEEK